MGDDIPSLDPGLLSGALLGDLLHQQAILPVIADSDADAHIVVGPALQGVLVALRVQVVGPTVSQSFHHAVQSTVHRLGQVCICLHKGELGQQISLHQGDTILTKHHHSSACHSSQCQHQSQYHRYDDLRPTGKPAALFLLFLHVITSLAYAYAGPYTHISKKEPGGAEPVCTPSEKSYFTAH